MSIERHRQRKARLFARVVQLTTGRTISRGLYVVAFLILVSGRPAHAVAVAVVGYGFAAAIPPPDDDLDDMTGR